MKIKELFRSTAIGLANAIVIGIVIGLLVASLAGVYKMIPVQILLMTKQLTSQIIFFMVPLITIGCIVSSITSFKDNAIRLLLMTIGIAYLSSFLAAIMSIGVSFASVPLFQIMMPFAETYILPKVIFPLQTPVIDTMSALLLSILLGLVTVWIRSARFASGLKELQSMVLVVFQRVLIQILPLFVGASFALLAVEGKLNQMAVFFPAIIIIVCCQFLWIVLFYCVAAICSKKNSWEVLRHYPQAYLTALGSMSSAATLSLALDCIKKSKKVSEEASDFALPLFCNIHLYGSVISKLFLVTTTYYYFFHHLPEIGNIILLAILVCIIAIGSPRVPGGINMSCSSLVMSVVLAANTLEMSDQFFCSNDSLLYYSKWFWNSM